MPPTDFSVALSALFQGPMMQQSHAQLFHLLYHSLQVQYHQFYNTNEDPRGRYIGMLERILIVVFVVSNLIQGLALIIAMKTLTRFKQFEDKRFAEYYLIGTLLSLLIGIILALMIKKIW